MPFSWVDCPQPTNRRDEMESQFPGAEQGATEGEERTEGVEAGQTAERAGETQEGGAPAESTEEARGEETRSEGETLSHGDADVERDPAADQAPTATAAQDAIIGDQGSRGEQQPDQMAGSQDMPLRTSPPPPEAQSGVPLPEDRAAGVEPGEQPPPQPGV